MIPELLTIRLADGSLVTWTAEHIAAYEADWTVNLATMTQERCETGYLRLMVCLAHGESETCEVCRWLTR